jgi:hypothetical protein
MSDNINAIIENPAEYGFEFLTETVKKHGKTSGPVPLIRLTDTAKFESHFPGVIVATEDGSSIRVKSQSVVREAWFSGKKDLDSLKRMLVSSVLLGIETVANRYGPGPEDEFYATPDELKAAWMEYATK